jgi:predicted transcriptional regulator
MNLTTTEVRRHISRLSDAGLVQRDLDGYYHLTPYGKTSLVMLQELEFLSWNKDYFKTHNPLIISTEYVKQMGKLREARPITDVMDFIRYTQNLLRQATKSVSIIIDQFPITLLPYIVDALDRGVKIKIIESKEQALEPDFSELTSEESRALSRTKTTPLLERRMLDDIHLRFYLSETNGILSFPSVNNDFDYTGFYCGDENALNWCNELFSHYWDKASDRIVIASGDVKRGYRAVQDRITIQGTNDLHVDVQAVQDAVDNYREVVLRGRFNFGTSYILISKSVKIRGEGRENEVPLTSISKKGWSFPFHGFTAVFRVDEDDLDIVIENLHFTDFNCACISSRTNIVNSMKILNNRISLITGFGRGISFASFGDIIQGILIHAVGKGGLLIEGNYIDFAEQGLWGGAISRGGLEEDPEYRPDLLNHEYYIGYGINVQACTGKVEIINNIIRNVNGRGISVSNHLETANVHISGNIIESGVYGSYPFSSRESGSAILAQTGLGIKSPNYELCIKNNFINLSKINQSGIVVIGPTNESSSKLIGGVIRENEIYLKNGYEGIHIRKCDDFEITGNKVSGKAFYGIRLSGRKKIGELNLGSYNNKLENNEFQEFMVKPPDEYVRSHLDGKYFTNIEPKTATFWFDKYTKNNQVTVSKNLSIIDEGENNRIYLQ